MERSSNRIILKIVIAFVLCTSMLIAMIVVSANETYGEPIRKYTMSEGYDRGAAIEMEPVIELALTNHEQAHKLLIGDSVCGQMFTGFADRNPEYTFAIGNQAATYVGQFLLAKNYIENNPQTTDVYLITSLLPGNGYSLNSLAYNYQIIPFTEAGLMDDIDSETMERIEGLYGSIWLNPTLVGLVDRYPLLKKMYFSTLKDSEMPDAQIALSQLEQLVKLCEDNDITFHFIHTPVNGRKEDTFNEERTVITSLSDGTGLEKIIRDYYDSAIVYPKEYFKDSVHFKDEYSTEEMLTGYIADMRSRTGDLEDIVTD